jgi:hypothetical protein
MHRRIRMTLPIPARYLCYFDHIISFIISPFLFRVQTSVTGGNNMLGAPGCCMITVVGSTYYMHLCFISQLSPIFKFAHSMPEQRLSGLYQNTSRWQNNISRSIALHKFAMETLQCTDIFFHAWTKTCQPIMILSLLLPKPAPRHDADSGVVQ